MQEDPGMEDAQRPTDVSGPEDPADRAEIEESAASADLQEPPTEYRGRIRILYPLDQGKIVLRTDQDWNRDVEPIAEQGGQRFEFEVTSEHPYLAFKACLRIGDELVWASGANKLALLGTEGLQSFYPHFRPTAGTITDIITLDSSTTGERRLRVYLPGGYEENTLKHYPVLFMQDGANVFFPEEAFLGQNWQMDNTVELLRNMNLIDQTIVVAVYPGDRMKEYTKPGYEAYSRSLVTEVKPYVDGQFRTLSGRRYTIVMGSSLGGVVAFYLAWVFPQVIGNAACLSSTFSWRDDLIERVRHDDIETRRELRIYLDSGWPRDNYEATLSMASALVERGFVLGRNVHHFAFPFARHDETSWASRCHLPLQLFAGRLRRAAAQRALASS